jgi:hypothetical protein
MEQGIMKMIRPILPGIDNRERDRPKRVRRGKIKQATS